MATCREILKGSTLDVLRGATLTEEQARAIFAQGEEAVVIALLELTKQLAEQKADAAGSSHETPATPSGMKPPYQKPPAKSRKKRPGAKKGHPDHRKGMCIYLPANGRLLSAVAMMATGWDGAPQRDAPGFPDNGKWKIRWEGLKPMP